MAEPEERKTADNLNPAEPEPHRHRYGIPFAMLFARRPTYSCRSCGQTLKPAKVPGIINQVLFYALLAAVIFSTDFSAVQKHTTQDLLIYLATVAGEVALYLLLKWLVARFGPLEAVAVQTPGAETLANEAEAREIYAAKMRALDAEKQALVDMYRQYAGDEAADGADSADAAPAAAGAEGAAASGASAPAGTARPAAEASADCPHRMRERWQNYLPGKRVFYCRHCDHPMKLSKMQGNIINGVFFLGFVLMLMRDMMNLQVGWDVIGIKVAILLAIVAVVQAVIIHLYPLEPMTGPEAAALRPRARRSGRS